MNLVHRNSFPNLSNFPEYFTQLGKFRGEANDKKHVDPGKKNPYSRKSRENSRNLLEAFLKSRKEENLYGHCDMNNARRILSKGFTLLRGCWFWSKSFMFKNFGRIFTAVEGVRQREKTPLRKIRFRDRKHSQGFFCWSLLVKTYFSEQISSKFLCVFEKIKFHRE